MRFTASTKPLKNVTDLGIIKANISRFYYRSSIVQITATRDTLKLNVEAAGIKSRMTLRGSGDEDITVATMVDCSVFKTLIDSIDADVMSLDFVEGGINIQAGTSKFTVPQMMDANEVQLDEPIEQYTAANTITVKTADWQFIKDHQLYAISNSAQHPVYKNVWISKDKDVLVGDMELNLFTYSKRGAFDTTCLFPASLVNLFTSIPDNSTVSRVGKNYVMNIETDSYSMLTEFTPKYEDDDAVGTYHSRMILDTMKHPDSYITLDVGPLTKFVNQASLLNRADMDKIIDFSVEDNTLTLTNKESSYATEVITNDTYSIKFSADLFKRVIANLDSDTIHVAPMSRDGMTIGCVFWTDTLTTVLAGQA